MNSVRNKEFVGVSSLPEKRLLPTDFTDGFFVLPTEICITDGITDGFTQTVITSSESITDGYFPSVNITGGITGGYIRR